MRKPKTVAAPQARQKNSAPLNLKSFGSRLFAPLNRLGIRSRLFVYFLIFTAVLLTVLWILQIALLPDFYQQQKTAMLGNAVDTLAQNIDNSDLQLLADRLSETNDLTVQVLDSAGNSLVTSYSQRNNTSQRMMNMDVIQYINLAKSKTSTQYQTYSMDEMHRNGYNANRFNGSVPPVSRGLMRNMVAVREVIAQGGEKRYILLSTQVTPVDTTVQTLSSQYLYIAVFMVLLSFLLSIVLSRRIVQPIIDTSEAAVQLSEGRFQPAVTSAGYREINDLNHTLTKAAKDLRRVEDMQRELVANISHDLRTPLTLIEGYAEAMRDLPGENTPENMQVIIDEARRLTSLVNAVMDYSAGKNGVIQIEPERYNLTASIRNILTRYQKLTAQEGYFIRFVGDGDATVKADEMKIGQVVYNLINNALTYTGDDKTVTVEQSILGGTVRIEVRDSGEGIAPEDLPFIWDRYYRGHKPHKRATVGTGLGLSIVKGILDAHGLHYGVDSQPGAGTTFWFELALMDNAQTGESAPKQA